MHAAAASAEEEEQPAPDAFWTACSTCRLMHQFHRRYVGHNLMCPSCKKSFLAVELSDNDSSEGEDDVDDDDGAFSRVRTRARASKIGKGGAKIERCSKSNRKMGNVREILKKAPRSTAGEDVEEDSDDELLGKLLPKRLRVEREMTLAEMQLEAKRKARQGKMKRKEAENGSKQDNDSGGRDAVKERNLKTYRRRSSEVRDTEVKRSRSEDLNIMAVKDSYFYDFQKDRMERGFKKGQVWAMYEDKDEMPRHYGLVENFVSVNPFEVEMSWLDLQCNGVEGLFPWDRYGLHTSCGRFKVARKSPVIMENIFSHVVDCDRVARELYWIYPKKGTVWALYKEPALENGGRKSMRPWHYDIVVMLSSYNDIFGVSMAYLEKLDGFRTVFRRKEIGCHAIRLLKRDELQLISHQIPAKKLSAEAPELLEDCWELDPAAIPI